MRGASQATKPVLSGARSRMTRIVFPMMPAARLFQPAWTAATTVPSRLARSTGKQSAVMTVQTTPGFVETEASASGSPSAVSASTTSVPCTCLSHTGSDGTSCATMERFMRTQAPKSPVCGATLRPMMPSALP